MLLLAPVFCFFFLQINNSLVLNMCAFATGTVWLKPTNPALNVRVDQSSETLFGMNQSILPSVGFLFFLICSSEVVVKNLEESNIQSQPRRTWLPHNALDRICNQDRVTRKRQVHQRRLHLCPRMRICRAHAASWLDVVTRKHSDVGTW